MEQYKDRIKYLDMSSIDAAKLFPDESFDFIYIDASHTYENCKQDIEAWFPKVRYSGILSGHDYPISGVNQAVMESIVGRKLYLWGVTAVTTPDQASRQVPSPLLDGADWWVHKEYWVYTKPEVKNA